MKKKYILVFIVIVLLCGIVLMGIIYFRHDHYESLTYGAPGHKVLEVKGEIIQYDWVDGAYYGVMKVMAEEGEAEALEIEEEFLVVIRTETVIKNKFGWRLDESALRVGQKVKICVDNVGHYEPIWTFSECHEIWIQ